jgi:flagellar protein FlaF
MGFSVSASTAIVFAGLFLVAGIIYPAISNGYEQVLDADVDRDDAQLDMRNSEITIDTVNADSITVNNTGSTSLTVSNVDLVIDGEYQQRGTYDTTVGTDSTTDLWLPGESLTLDNFDGTVEIDSRVKVVTDHGLSVTREI